jgi:dolichyl-phosphate-mannose-protein mannosyltransferase
MDTTDNRLPDDRTARGVLALGLLLIGILLWAFCLHAASGTVLQWELTAAAVVVGCVPRLRVLIAKALDRVRRPSPTQRFRVAVVISISTSALFLALAYAQGWDFILRYQDEHSFMVQLQMLARGRLWMPPLPSEIADFFSAFAIFTQPTYGSIYLPGTALMYVPAIWLHLPYWVLPLIAAGACVGLTYRIITELTDGVGGMLAAMMMASLPAYRSLALMLLSQTPMLQLGLLMIWSWLRWRNDRRLRWTMAIGFFSGWAMITRPLDALAYTLPIGFVVLRDLSNTKAGFAGVFRTLVVMIVCASPFLVIDVVQNRGMTGDWLESPYVDFAKANYPAPMFGFHAIDWSHAPLPKLAEDREVTENSFWPTYRAHRLAAVPSVWWTERLPRTLTTTMPDPLLAGFIPIGLLALTDRRRRLLAATAGLFLALYVFSVWYQPHYVLVIVPGMLFLVILGIERVGLLWPTASTTLALIVAAISLGAMAQTDAINWSPWLDLVRIEDKLATLPSDPAIVLFRYHPRNPSVNIAHHEPVYNTTAIWPDDARIIRAHDLGAENIRLFQYYARTQPDRVIYLYDRDGDTLTRLGTPADAARSYNEALRSTHGR